MLEGGRWSQEIVLPDPVAGSALPLSTLCGPLFDAAGVHASRLDLGVSELRTRDLTWMLSRFRLVIAERPPGGETVTVTTWPSGAERLFALREFRMTSAAGVPLASATSAWLLVDLKSRRPIRPDPFVAHLRVPGRALEVPLDKLAAPAEAAWTRTVTVRPGDIDFNGHVGSVCYVRWIEDALAAQEGRHPVLADLEINYLAEVFLGDAVRVAGDGRPAADGRKGLALTREDDGLPVATAAVL
jgi:medium-chain acyl-[acyl-carrier-protein] hydrolase